MVGNSFFYLIRSSKASSVPVYSFSTVNNLRNVSESLILLHHDRSLICSVVLYNLSVFIRVYIYSYVFKTLHSKFQLLLLI